MHARFKNFLLNENKYYLGQKAGDLLSSVQAIGEDAPNLGNRALIRAVQSVINQIRKTLHGRWDDGDVKYLKVLQKIGVALCKAIDDKEDMASVVSSVATTLEDLVDKMGVPVNTLASDEGNDGEPGEEPLQPGSDVGA